MSDATVEVLVEITQEDIDRSERGTRYSPAFYAFRRAFGRDVVVMKGPSTASAQDKWQDHREWIAVIPDGAKTRDFKLTAEWQLLQDWWTYGPKASLERYAECVRPMSMTVPASK